MRVSPRGPGLAIRVDQKVPVRTGRISRLYRLRSEITGVSFEKIDGVAFAYFGLPLRKREVLPWRELKCCWQHSAKVGDLIRSRFCGPALDVQQMGHVRPAIKRLDICSQDRTRQGPTAFRKILGEPNLKPLSLDSFTFLGHGCPPRGHPDQFGANVLQALDGNSQDDRVEVGSLMEVLCSPPCQGVQ
jgi:hypothetical protein